MLAEVRRQLAEPAKGNVDRQDRAALTAFYAARNEPLLWVTGDGFTAKAKQAMAEIRKADDWGLKASAFELPQLAPERPAPDALADAEIKLGLAALKYARHAAAGASTRRDRPGYRPKPTFHDPKDVMEAIAAARRPATICATSSQAPAVRAAAPGDAEGPQRTPDCAGAGEDGHDQWRLPDGPNLKIGSEHPQIALLRQRLGLQMPPRRREHLTTSRCRMR